MVTRDLSSISYILFLSLQLDNNVVGKEKFGEERGIAEEVSWNNFLTHVLSHFKKNKKEKKQNTKTVTWSWELFAFLFCYLSHAC